MAHLAAGALEVSPESVLVASTGVIGPQIVMNPLKQAMPGLVEALELDGWKDAARAIMTTDTVPKLASTKLELEGREVTIGGIAKGSGMIAPRMATLLGFVCTDAAVAPHVLTSLVRQSAARSFNAITIDGDTSTNDTLLAMAGGAAGNPPLTAPETPACRLFAKALEAVFLDLACQIVRDGEGATKFIEVAVTGAESEESARAVAFTVANSPLVKTAFFGEDANWGRIIAAAGRAGVPIEPEKVVLHFGAVCVFQDGGPVEDPRVEAQASEELRQKDIRVRLDLGKGPARFTAYTSDLSYDYVKINADYRT
jgi:glutamate N-acetyltransferase/amino-acid N-acetyltransferase